MTESLADGPDWHLSDLDFVPVYHSSPLWTNGAALRSMNSIDEILGDKELKRKLVDLQKRFLIYRMHPKYLAAHQCVAAIRMKASTSLQRQDVWGIIPVDW